jgi:hypothetical protein
LGISKVLLSKAFITKVFISGNSSLLGLNLISISGKSCVICFLLKLCSENPRTPIFNLSLVQGSVKNG